MRILLLAPHPYYQERGTPIAVDLLVRALARYGCKVDILTYNEGANRSYSGVRILRLRPLIKVQNVKPGFSFKKLYLDMNMFFRLILQLTKERYDIVHAVEEAGFMAMIVCSVARKPYVLDVDSSMTSQLVDQYSFLAPFSLLLESLEALPARYARAVVTMCDELAKRALKHRRDGVFVLKDISLVDSAKDRAFNLRDIELSEDDDLRVAMYIGNLENYQGIDLLLESFVKVTRVDERVRLIVIGGAEQDVARYRARAMSLSIDSRCHFLGPRPVGDLGAYMRLADVLVSPRIRGTNTPMKIYSYLDSGIPVVVTNLRTHTQVVTNDLAFIAEPTPEDFSAKILKAISDPESAHAKSRAARAYVRREHSHEAFQSKVQELISYVEKHVHTPPRAVRSRWS